MAENSDPRAPQNRSAGAPQDRAARTATGREPAPHRGPAADGESAASAGPRSARHRERSVASAREEASQRAELAAHSVLELFTHRLLGVPGTLIGEPAAPAPKELKTKVLGWNYWWQTHLLDAIVDAGLRAHREHRSELAREWLQRGRRLLRGIRWHNGGTYVNSFFDDMAWLTLAVRRLDALSRKVDGEGSAPAQDAARTLYPQLRRAITAETGGGAFWSKKLDFKNTPATASIALALAHAGQAQTSQRLLDWLRKRLFAEGQGYWDGIKLVAQQDGTVEHRVERNLYSYNQGTVLGALLETPGADLEHAEELIGLIAEKMTTSLEVEGTPVRILNTRGSGDAGLFAGILARYLTQAARDTRLASTARATARDLVLATAELLWAGRREFDPDLPLNEDGVDVTEVRGTPVAVFSPDASRPTSQTLPAGAPVQLSSQVQAWTILEAAARLS